jgi:hypothetical protein
VPVVTPANSYLLGIFKQTNEATVGTVATYSLPVFSADVGPRYDLRRVEVTDAESIEGDPYKAPSFWTATTEFPAFANSLGTFLQSLWPTDTTTGAGPYVHTFSGLGGTQSWIALFSEWVNASNYEQTFGKGIATGITFAATADGGPLRVGFTAMGQTVTKQANTVTTANVLTDGYYSLQLTSASIEADFDSPNANPAVPITNVRDVSINVARGATPEPTADGTTVTNIGLGKVTSGGSLTLLYDTFGAYEASYLGSVGGTTLSPTILYGALALNFKHSVSATSLLEIYVPKVQFMVTPPTPDPSGAALTQTVTLNMAKPTTGSRVQPILTNDVSASY